MENNEFPSSKSSVILNKKFLLMRDLSIYELFIKVFVNGICCKLINIKVLMKEFHYLFLRPSILELAFKDVSEPLNIHCKVKCKRQLLWIPWRDCRRSWCWRDIYGHSLSIIEFVCSSTQNKAVSFFKLFHKVLFDLAYWLSVTFNDYCGMVWYGSNVCWIKHPCQFSPFSKGILLIVNPYFSINVTLFKLHIFSCQIA